MSHWEIFRWKPIRCHVPERTDRVRFMVDGEPGNRMPVMMRRVLCLDCPSHLLRSVF